MKAETSATIINSVMWIGVTIAIVTALIITKRLSVFWFYLIPALSTMQVKRKSSEEESE